MTREQDSNSGLILPNRFNHLFTHEESLLAPDEIQKAVAVAQLIVSTHESTINTDTFPDHLGSYSATEIQSSTATLTRYLVEKFRFTPYKKRIDKKDPLYPSRELNYGFLPKVGTSATPDNDQDMSIAMNLGLGSGQRYIKSEFPAYNENRPVDRMLTGFFDSESEMRKVVLFDLEKDFDLSKYRFMWRGLRWMMANALTWDQRGVLYPEDLDFNQEKRLDTPPPALLNT